MGVVQYANYLIDDLGTPPDHARAEMMSREYFFEISYQSPDLSWTTSGFEYPEHPVWKKTLYENSNTRIEQLRGCYFVIIDKGTGKFIFMSHWGFGPELMRFDRVVMLVALLSVLLLAAYIIIRRLLKPIKMLTEGVHQISTGNLEHTVPGKGSDELADLAAAFNNMTERIRDMLHARERLMLDVSHELRTPLTRIKVALEFLPKGDARESISEDVSEMEKMITEILETARMQNTGGHLDKKMINIVALIEEVIRLFDHQAPGVEFADISHRIDMPVDPELIKTVLKNILTNAIKYSEENGPPVHIVVKKKDGQAIIEIRDSGIGIPKEELPYIFEPFYRVDKSRSKRSGGYGLGLSLCKTIMDAHNAKIEVDSRTGKGTVVSLIFSG